MVQTPAWLSEPEWNAAHLGSADSAGKFFACLKDGTFLGIHQRSSQCWSVVGHNSPRSDWDVNFVMIMVNLSWRWRWCLKYWSATLIGCLAILSCFVLRQNVSLRCLDVVSPSKIFKHSGTWVRKLASWPQEATNTGQFLKVRKTARAKFQPYWEIFPGEVCLFVWPASNLLLLITNLLFLVPLDMGRQAWHLLV